MSRMWSKTEFCPTCGAALPMNVAKSANHEPLANSQNLPEISVTSEPPKEMTLDEAWKLYNRLNEDKRAYHKGRVLSAPITGVVCFIVGALLQLPVNSSMFSMYYVSNNFIFILLSHVGFYIGWVMLPVGFIWGVKSHKASKQDLSWQDVRDYETNAANLYSTDPQESDNWLVKAMALEQALRVIDKSKKL
ncbi:MAG: hypothetical protein FWG68_04225 [Defluviitaleaceae bacterium]|nr:hypothetical protein [Defluviitaleaceae bacterium]